MNEPARHKQGVLFLLVKAIAHNIDVSIPADEATFVKSLHKKILTHPSLMSVYKDILTDTSTVFIEAYLPLFGRLIQNTVGLVDADDAIIYIPNQWFAVQTEEYPEVIKKHVSPTKEVSYTIDFDEDYTDRYAELATEKQWPTTIDTIRFQLHDTRTNRDTESVPTRIESVQSLEQLVDIAQTTLRFESNYERQFVDAWGGAYYFDADDIPNVSRFPNPLHPQFHHELYKTNSFAFSRIMHTGDTNHMDNTVFTIKDHQQYVRNLISPVTPYHSLLVVHSTGSGKTFTTFGITEQFRDIAYIQHRKIHITCPRREICDEFHNYLKGDTSPNTPQNYVYGEYEKEMKMSVPFFTDKDVHRYAQDHYNIATYYSIFPKSYYTYVTTLQRVLCAWQVVLPTIHTTRRTPEGFLLVSTPVKKEHMPTLQSSLQTISEMYATTLNETWQYTFVPIAKELHIVVSNVLRLMQFEKHLVDTYASTVFVIDEAHRINKDDGALIASKEANVREDGSTQNINWTFMLSFVIGVLRYHHCRMRLVLLTATPMQNESQDMIRLLNLMIHNDGYKQEEQHKIYKKRKITQRSQNEKDRLAISIAARVSYFKDDRGKPIKLVAEDIFYNVPRIQSRIETCCGAVCTVLCVASVGAFLTGTTAMHTPSIVWDQRKASKRSHAIPLDHIKKTGSHPHQTYVYIVLNPHITKASFEQWMGLCGEHLHINHTVVLLTSSKSFATRVASNKAVSVLFTNTSIRHPFIIVADSVHSRYKTTLPPTICSHKLSNLEPFFSTYYHNQQSHRMSKDYKNTPTIITTPMQNQAFLTTDDKVSLRYRFVGHRINNWNVHDKTDRLYQPKIDTMLSLMEMLPGNVLIYTNEVQLGKGGALSLKFLKRIIEQRFRKRKHSRLSNVVVEILHKETLSYADDSDFANALNRRIHEINTTLLAKRNDIVLIGSTEIREGLTLDEIRQVHMLDVSWNIAQMQQILGRAIRINNHRKCKHMELHNVACFLHITVPETVVDEPQSHQTLSKMPVALHKVSRMSYLERMIGDLHRFKCLHNKIDDIVHATNHLQLNAFDIVFLNVRPQAQLSLLAENDEAVGRYGWMVRKYKKASSLVLQAVHQKQGQFTTIETACKNRTYLEPKEIMRKEIDILKSGICKLFRDYPVPFLTYHELNAVLRTFGVFNKPSAIASSFVIKPTSNDAPTTTENKQQLLLSILCCQYKWFIKEHTDKFYILKVDPKSVIDNPEWQWTTSVTGNHQNWTLTDIRKHSTPECKVILDKLAQMYAVLIDPTKDVVSRTFKMFAKTVTPLHGVGVQHITTEAFDSALYELMHNNTPIEHVANCFYRLVYHDPFYTLERLHTPTTQALWNVETRTELVIPHTMSEEPAPYSIPIMKSTLFSMEHIKDTLTEMEQTLSTLFALFEPVCSVQTVHLKTYLAEYIFDNASLTVQESLLRNLCIYGFNGLSKACALQATHQELLMNCVFHRYCEKGIKSTDCEPPKAHAVLNACFPNRVGRLHCSFPFNPATEHCSVQSYSLAQSQGHTSTIPYQPYSGHIKQKKLHTDLLMYFSPIPISKTNDEALFYSSKRISNASTAPLNNSTPLFGYNEVLNYKNKSASHLKSFLCTFDHHIGYELMTDEALRCLTDFEEMCESSIFKKPLVETEATLRSHIEGIDTLTIRLQTKRLCRFLFLRYHQLYLRYFYSGIITKHPNREYYANYKHSLKKKIL